MQQYFTPNIKESNFLENVESTHLIKVMRKKAGDRFYSTDGLGSLFELEIIEANPKKVSFNIIKEEKKETQKPEFSLYIALTKNINRIEWLLEKCTEIGIANIYPILCEKSERKHFRKERLERVLIAAIKQSQRCFLPKLHEMQKFGNALKNIRTKVNFIASYNSENFFLEDALKKEQDASIFIGPEGDFSEKEIKMTKDFGLKCVNLSNARLRTETAALVACQTFNSINR